VREHERVLLARAKKANNNCFLFLGGSILSSSSSILQSSSRLQSSRSGYSNYSDVFSLMRSSLKQYDDHEMADSATLSRPPRLPRYPDPPQRSCIPRRCEGCYRSFSEKALDMHVRKCPKRLVFALHLNTSSDDSRQQQQQRRNTTVTKSSVQ
jgi:hypothetical protein